MFCNKTSASLLKLTSLTNKPSYILRYSYSESANGIVPSSLPIPKVGKVDVFASGVPDHDVPSFNVPDSNGITINLESFIPPEVKSKDPINLIR